MRCIAPALALFLAACAREPQREPQREPASKRPSILLVTLDTTRADAIGPGAKGIETPVFNDLAGRGRLFRQAYASVPETLPSHASMLTGLYPAGHGVRENGRTLASGHPLVSELLRQRGYRTAAFVSAFVLARRFGLSRGFDTYDDDLVKGRAERSAAETTDRVLAFLAGAPRGPLFLWVHYYDAHHPYEPREPFRARYAKNPYLGEVAAMDEQLGRLLPAFERYGDRWTAVAIAGDHGEGLGEHGESQHGNLLYQSTMRVPLLLWGAEIRQGVDDTPVSTRRVFHTILDWAGLETASSLRDPLPEVVLGEAMKPFLSYGWQPQTMAVEGSTKAIVAGRTEVYDVLADAGETRDLAATAELSRAVRNALKDYPAPAAIAAPARSLSADEQKKLASLGYVSAGAAPIVRPDAPRPTDKVKLFETLERASALFVAERYAEVIPLLERIRAEDPENLDAALRLGTAHSALGQRRQADAAFERAAAIAPQSPDVRVYRALHLARGDAWRDALPLLERVVAESPERLPALEALAGLREREGRTADAILLRRRVYALREPSALELLRLGQLAMSLQQTPLALESFEKARTLQGKGFAHDLELGVLYLAARRYAEARDALDRVTPAQHDYPMALFKRAQVSVLLSEPDRAQRIQLARDRADATTRELIRRERLFLEQ